MDLLSQSSDLLSQPPYYGYFRYGFPYTYFGTWYKPQGYYSPSYMYQPYNQDYGTQQNSSCKTGCLSRGGNVQQCFKVCENHRPFYNFSTSY